MPAVSPQTGSTPPPPPIPIFATPRYFNDVDGLPVDGSEGGPNRLYRTLADQKYWSAETGITGEVGGFGWEVFYSHSNSELTVTNPNNTDNAKYLASLDAVNDGGTIKCWVSTQPQFAVSLSRLRALQYHGIQVVFRRRPMTTFESPLHGC